ncbi:MAG: 50S ribosomal protein L18 [Planctomycetes bacterium]|nr:50S ribosomal protein L18 [Planctomycetota bacterium]
MAQMSPQLKAKRRLRRKRHIRRKVSGSSLRPRMSVFRSLSHIYVQVIDDESGRTLCASSTCDKEVREGLAGKFGGNQDAAKVVGGKIAERATAAGLKQVIFDRNGFKYHGRVKALAEAAREGGLEF